MGAVRVGWEGSWGQCGWDGRGHGGSTTCTSAGGLDEVPVPCAACAGSRSEMLLYCVRCERHLCRACAGGAQRTVCALVECDPCLSVQAGQHDIIHNAVQGLRRLQLQQQTSEVLRYVRRDSTMEVHRRAMAYLQQYADYFGSLTVPCSALQLSHIATFLLTSRAPWRLLGWQGYNGGSAGGMGGVMGAVRVG